MLKYNIIAATVLAAGLIVAAFVHSGRYYALIANGSTLVKIDRWTGETKLIFLDSENVKWEREFGVNKAH